MKTKILTFSLLLASCSLFAQNWLLTGNSIAVGDYLGTNNNQPLHFHTNATQRMTITSTGLVGIGFNTPSQKLDVEDGNINPTLPIGDL